MEKILEIVIVCLSKLDIFKLFQIHNHDKTLLRDIFNALNESCAIKIFEFSYTYYADCRYMDKHDILLLYLENTSFMFVNNKYERSLRNFTYNFGSFHRWLYKYCDAGRYHSWSDEIREELNNEYTYKKLLRHRKNLRRSFNKLVKYCSEVV